MKLMAFVLVCSSVASAVSAQTIRESAVRAVAAQAARPAPLHESHGRHRSGLVLTGVGGVLMVLGVTAIKSKPPIYRVCEELNTEYGFRFACAEYRGTNVPLVSVGAVVTGLGIALAATPPARSNRPSAIVGPQRFGVQQSVSF